MSDKVDILGFSDGANTAMLFAPENNDKINKMFPNSNFDVLLKELEEYDKAIKHLENAKKILLTLLLKHSETKKNGIRSFAWRIFR